MAKIGVLGGSNISGIAGRIVFRLLIKRRVFKPAE
jgi:hypothetical protein